MSILPRLKDPRPQARGLCSDGPNNQTCLATRIQWGPAVAAEYRYNTQNSSTNHRISHMTVNMARDPDDPNRAAKAHSVFVRSVRVVWWCQEQQVLQRSQPRFLLDGQPCVVSCEQLVRRLRAVVLCLAGLARRWKRW